MGETADVVVVGGGAAGLASAIFAAQGNPSKRVVVLEGAKTLGAKILVSGGGRCNVTHDVVGPEDYFSVTGGRNVVRNILAGFGVGDTIKWFASMGVELKREETGKLFPVADSARVVLEALLRRCGELGVVIRAGCRVSAVERPGFRIRHGGGEIVAERLILATGGRSLPRSGSDGAGWEMAKGLGHTVTATYAALAPLVLDGNKCFHVGLAGIAQEVELATFVGNQLVDRRRGSMLWTHFGVSGPVVMDASRHWVIAHESGEAARMSCNLLPGETFESVEKWLIDAAGRTARVAIAKAVAMRLPERVAAAVVIHAGVDPAIACGQVNRESRRALVHALTALELPVSGHRGWNYAEVTAGGVPLAEIDYRTMESRKTAGLHLVGEILDCDGRIGGFNFQWAWATGYLAGRGLKIG